MAKSIEERNPEMIRVNQKAEDIFLSVSSALKSDVQFVSPVEGEKVTPLFDINGIISKLVALMVYSGMVVPSSFAPAFNRVHADVEFWKKTLEQQAAENPTVKITEVENTKTPTA